MANSSISPDYFWYEMSIYESIAVSEAISDAKQYEWELMRVSTFHLVQPYLDPKKTRNLTPKSMIPSPWDKETDVKKNTTSVKDKKSIIERMANKKALTKKLK